jgi:predicted PurR-regulated permease PerM
MAINNKYVWLDIILIIGALALGYILLKPFLTALVFAIVIAYILYPAHKVISAKVGNTLSAALLTSLAIVVTIACIIFGVKLILQEISRVFVAVANFDFSKIVPDPNFASSAKEITRLVVSKVLESFSSAITKLPHVILSLFIFFVTLFFFLRDGKWVWLWIQDKIPLQHDHKLNIFENLRKYAKAFIQIWLIIGLLQALVAIIGFALFGLPYGFLAGFLALLLSILPIIGPWAMYVPIGIMLILEGNPDTGVGILVYGLAISGFLDYVIRPYYAGRWSAVHPLIILLGILGGLFVLGPAGFIVGPILLLLIISILQGAGAGFIKGRHI